MNQGKKKQKGKAISLAAFHASVEPTSVSHNTNVSTGGSARMDWAAEMEKLDDDTSTNEPQVKHASLKDNIKPCT